MRLGNKKLHFWFMCSMLVEGMRETLPLGVWGFFTQMLQNQWNKYIRNFLFWENHLPVPSFIIWIPFITKQLHGSYCALYCPPLSVCLVLQPHFYLTFKEIYEGQGKYYKYEIVISQASRQEKNHVHCLFPEDESKSLFSNSVSLICSPHWFCGVFILIFVV